MTATSSTFLNKVKKAGRKLPSRNVLLGVEGIGKTGMLCYAKDPLCIMVGTETGLETLVDNNLVPETDNVGPVTSWTDMLKCLQEISTMEEIPWATVFVDTGNSVCDLLIDHVIRTDFGGSKSKYIAWSAGPRSLPAYWRQYLNLLNAINSRGVQVWQLCHTQVVDFKNPEGENYHRYLGKLDPELWGLCKEESDNVFFANFHTEVEDKKGAGGKDRYIYTERRPGFDAKNRCNLGDRSISMGSSPKEAWKNLTDAIKAARPKAAPKR